MDAQAPYVQNTLQIKIFSPRSIVFEGTADSVSSQNSAGKFDILPEHANFITLVQDIPIIIRQKGAEDKIFQFPLAIIYNTTNRVHIYTDIQQSLNPNQTGTHFATEILDTQKA